MTALTAGDDAPQHPGIGATPAAVAPVHDERADARDPQELRAYVNDLFHRWSMTLSAIAFTLVPAFFLLDFMVVPPELLGRFALFRGLATVVPVVQFFNLRATKPSNRSLIHGYLLTIVTAGAIALMTTHLGGFNSPYYAGLNLVIIAIVVLLPWGFAHSVANSAIVLGLYVGLNLLIPSPEPMRREALFNNLYFLVATAVIAVAINVVKQRLIAQEFWGRSSLSSARDALWGEMELAKRIQTALLPRVDRVPGYRVAARMQPTAEVGGDYYDILQTAAGETWLAMGDVSGHGVASGLIMMMTQTSISTIVDRTTGYMPSRVLELVNSVVKQNISRLRTDRYMSLCIARLDGARMTFAGKHQDILIWRSATRSVETVATTGTWLGLVDDLTGKLSDQTVEIAEGDAVLFFTDGITEAMNAEGEMYGHDRLQSVLRRHGQLEAEQIVIAVLAEVEAFQARQADDITLLVLKRVQTGRRADL
jgi:sigma-B regulation protein RsbU (phosphoserine phosphatase)